MTTAPVVKSVGETPSITTACAPAKVPSAGKVKVASLPATSLMYVPAERAVVLS